MMMIGGRLSLVAMMRVFAFSVLLLFGEQHHRQHAAAANVDARSVLLSVGAANEQRETAVAPDEAATMT
eukprot:scaffold251469_cov14-Prasinocladus_malaysianus.AAC.1